MLWNPSRAELMRNGREKEHRNDDSRERVPESDNRRQRVSDHPVRPKDREKCDSCHRVRNYDRDVHDTLDYTFSGEVASCKEVRQRHPEYERYGSRNECGVHRQEDRF